jgi:hypothetical protein
MPYGQELLQFAQAFDPVGAMRKAQLEPQKFEIQKSILDEQTKDIQQEKQQSLQDMARGGVGYDGKPLQQLANQIIPGATLTRDDGTITDAGLYNQKLVDAQKMSKQGQMMLRQAALIDDPAEQAKAMDSARRYIRLSQVDVNEVQKEIKEKRESGIYGAAMAQNKTDWDNAIKAYEETGLPFPPNFNRTYSPENVSKMKLYGSANLQNRINDDLRKRQEDIDAKENKRFTQTKETASLQMNFLKTAAELGIKVPKSMVEEVFGKQAFGTEETSITPTSAGSKLTPERQYNVGNLRPSGFTYKGQTGVDKNGFATFDTPEAGIKALQQDIDSKLSSGLNTPQKFIEKYAPPKSKGGDNPDATTNAYINNVAKALGIKPTDKIEDTPENRKILQDAIIKQEGIGYPAEPKTDQLVTLKKQSTASLPQERAYNVLEATIQAVNDLENISRLPEGTALPALSGLTSKDPKGLISGLTGIFSRTVTPQDERDFEQLAAGLESAMATAVGGGYASAATTAKMQQYAKQLPRSGDSAEAAVIALARMKQELQTVLKGYTTRIGASDEQKDLMRKELDRLNKAIPFDIDQVMEAKKQKAGGKTLGESYKTEETQNKTSTGVTWSIK